MIKIIFETDEPLDFLQMRQLRLFFRLKNNMQNSVLCVIDLSASSRKALQWAIEDARRINAHLTVLYPYRLSRQQNGENVVQLRKKIEEQALMAFAELERDLLKGSKISYDFRTEVGFLSDRVEEHSRSHPLNVLVVNKGLRTAQTESFDELVESMDVPVVIIP
jgi:hypothetical protein